MIVGGESVISGGDDGTIRLWSLDTGDSQRVIRLANPIQDLSLSADGRSVCAALGSHVNVVPLNGAGGYFGATGDYLYRDVTPVHADNGEWGILRVE